jgi:hypothetical protein
MFGLKRWELCVSLPISSSIEIKRNIPWKSLIHVLMEMRSMPP